MLELNIDPDEVLRRLKLQLPDWRLESGCIVKTFTTTGWKSSMLIANAIGYLAENAWHHPKLVVDYADVTIWLTTHSAGGITEKDFALASKIEELLSPPSSDSALRAPPDQYAILKH